MPGFNLHGCIDAQVWAEEFCRINPSMDEGTMLAWFANAIMSGIDSEQQKPVHTLATATNRELANAFAERFGFRLKKAYPGKSIMVDEKNQTCIFLEDQLGPWQDSLIEPEV